MRSASLSLLLCLAVAACSTAPPRRAGLGHGAAGTSPGTASRGAARAGALFVDHSAGQEEVSIQAMSLVGVPYRWGGNSPEGGFDCSGLVRYVLMRSASVTLPRTTAAMSLSGKPVEPGEIAPGDLVFFNTTGRAHSHVGIYVGGYRFVNAPSTGGSVRLDSLESSYWGPRFDGIRRVAGSTEAKPSVDFLASPLGGAQAPPALAAPPPGAPVTGARPPAGTVDPIAAFAGPSF